jgi:hypothetical protein
MECSRCKKETRKPYALYEIYPDGKKMWRTDLCRICDSQIGTNNMNLKLEYPHMKWKE